MYRYEEDSWSWAQVPLKHSDKPLKNPTVLIFDHFLVIKLHYDEKEGEGVNLSPETCKPVVLLIVDLSDDSVQEVEIKDKSWLFDQQKYNEAPYSLTKYRDNQIVKFGKTEEGKTVMSLITIESFKPFAMKSEDIVEEGMPDLSRHTAQIHDDFLYILGAEEQKEKENDLWRFDLKNRKWELLKTTGKGPGGIAEPLSFFFGDNLYIHGEKEDNLSQKSHLFMLNLQSLSWVEFERAPNLGHNQLDRSIYKSNLVFLNDLKSKDGEVQCRIPYYWAIARTDRFKCLRPRETEARKFPRDLIGTCVVYNNYLITFTFSKTVEGGFDFTMFVFNLENDFPSWDPGYSSHVESSEESKFRTLYAQIKFAAPKEADIVMFRVQDKEIPAHKEVVMKRLGKFLNGGSIDVPDCDEVTFRKFLQFVYCKEVPWDNHHEDVDDNLVINLLILADKFLLYGLRDRCMEFLKHNITSGNIFRLYDFVCEQRIPRFKVSFNKLLKKNITVNNISRVIKYLENQEIPHEDLLDMKANAITILFKNFGEIYERDNENLGFYKDFLLRSIGIDTILLFSKLVYEQRTESFDLGDALLDFGKKNFQEMKDKGIIKNLPTMFMADLVSSVL